MKPSLTLRILVALFLTIGAPIAASQAHAQESGSMWSIQTAGPQGADGRGRFVWELEPGASLGDYVYVQNQGEEPLSLEVYASDAITTDGGGFDLLPADTAPTDVGAWVEVDSSVVTLEPQQGAVVPFTLRVPDNATPGDHAGGIVASLTRIGEDGEENQVRVDYRVGVRIYLQVTGELAPGLVIQDVKLDHSDASLFPASGGDAEVTYTLRNTGNVRLSAVQSVRITGPFGITLATSSPEEIAEVLPGQSLRGVASLSGVAPLFNLKAHVSLEPRLPDGSPAEGVTVLSASASTWSLPLSQLLLLAATVALAVVSFRLRSRRRETAAIAASFSHPSLANLIPKLNKEYASEILRAGRIHADAAGVSSALISNLDRDGADLVTVADGEAKPVRVRWTRRLNHPDEAIAEIRKLTDGDGPRHEGSRE